MDAWRRLTRDQFPPARRQTFADEPGDPHAGAGRRGPRDGFGHSIWRSAGFSGGWWPMFDQAQRIASHAEAEGAVVAFSSDLGPDLLVPWRHPTLTVVYSDSDLPLGDAGLVPAEGRSDASVIVRWTSDVTLLSSAPGWSSQVRDFPLVDPVQQWWDLPGRGILTP